MIFLEQKKTEADRKIYIFFLELPFRLKAGYVHDMFENQYYYACDENNCTDYPLSAEISETRHTAYGLSSIWELEFEIMPLGVQPEV